MITYKNISPESRVWVYQSNRNFSDQEVKELGIVLEKFAEEWQAHGKNLSAYASIYHKRFIVLMVDESAAGASGCSIDASVHFMQEIEKQYAISLFDRLSLAYEVGAEIKTVKKSEISQLFQAGSISEETLVFNNMVSNKNDFQHNWKIPLAQSWAAACLSKA